MSESTAFPRAMAEVAVLWAKPARSRSWGGKSRSEAGKEEKSCTQLGNVGPRLLSLVR